MVRFTSTARTQRRLVAAESLRSGRRTLRRLMDENAALLRDLDELRILREMSHLDPLSGVPSRRLFEERLSEELSRADGSPLARGALLAVDVNDLELVNDRYGHAAGDHLLRDVADIVRGALRRSDVCCRTGGDEFMILLPDTDPRGAELVMSRLRVAVIRASARQEVPVGISIGSASWPTDSLDAEALIARADRSMYAEKRRLRKRATCAPPQGARKLALVK